jgi:hypothetical protein
VSGHDNAATWRWRVLATALAVLPIAAVHAWLVRGYVRGSFYGDHGRWLHEVQRFAEGQVLYHDFTWPFPPLALWVVGTPARFLGADVAVISATTTAIFLLASLLFVFWIAELTRDTAVAVVAALAGLLSALWAAQIGSSPLPAGMYSPAAPLGAAFLLGSLVAWIHSIRSDGILSALLAGLLAGCAVLTKQDFWLPAAVLIGGGSVSAWLSGRTSARVAAAAGAGALTAGVIGLTAIIATAGTDAAIGMVTGFGQAGGSARRGLPTLSRLTVEILAIAAWSGALLWLFALARRSGRIARHAAVMTALAAAAAGIWIAATVHVVTTVSPDAGSWLRERLSWQIDNGVSLLRPTAGLLRADLLRHVLPVTGPLIVAGFVFRWKPQTGDASDRRFLYLVLLVVVFAARARRMFEYVEWFHYMLEVPLYAGILLDMWRGRRATVRGIALALLVPLIPLALYQYRAEGIGPFTRDVFYQPVATPRGTIMLREDPASIHRDLTRVLTQIDPTGERPVFAYGKTGGINYFLDRRNPTSSTHGFELSGDADRVMAELERDPSTIYIDVPIYDVENKPLNQVLTWDTRSLPTPYIVHDRPLFNRLVDGCAVVERQPAETAIPFFIVIDCMADEPGRHEQTVIGPR